MRASGPSLCDSRSTSYFDRPTSHISRYRSDDSYMSTTSSMAMTRKRPRLDSSHYNDVRTPRAYTSSNDLNASTSSFGLASPSPLVNTDYHLFGGMDTPGTWSEQREERARIEDAERDYRQNRFSEKSDHTFFSDRSTIQKSQDESSTDMSASTTLSGWHLRRTAWALTGGLAGKIFNFCWNTTFRGFKAGGGQAYNIGDADNTDLAQDGHKFDPGASPRLEKYSRDDISRYPSHSQQTTEDQLRRGREDVYHRPIRTPTSHQRYMALEDSAVRNNWVFVETTPNSPEEHSPVRKRSRASMATSGRSQNAPQPTANSRPHTASFASSRPRTASNSSRIHSFSNNYSYTNAGNISPISVGPKAKRPRVSMGHGYTSPTKRQSSYITTLPQSPISPEIETFQRKRRKEAKKNDESLKRLNAQLQDMIREGQEALGSRIEIVEFGDGHGRRLDSEDSDQDNEMDGSYMRGDMR